MNKRSIVAFGWICSFVFGSLPAFAQPTGYSYAKQITIQSSQVSGGANLTNFPVLISVTDNNLRTTANGGHVTNANGYDIVFYTSDCLTQLSHQIESYTATSGNFVAWVNVPTVSASSNTVIHMYYGKSSVTTDPSTTAVWDSNYKAVWHFNNSVNDNTSNGKNLTNNSTTTLAAAKIAAGRDLNNSSNVLSSNAGIYLQAPNGLFSGISGFTFEGWVLLDRADTNWERIFDFGQGTNVNFFLTPSSGTSTSSADVRSRITTTGNGGEQGPVITVTPSTGSWTHWSVVIDNTASTMTIYRNGASYATASSVSLRPSNLEASTANYFGRSQYGADHYIDAKFDEFRISSSVRTAGWITTSYNNQNTPSSFYSIGSEVTAATLCAILPIKLLGIKATEASDGIDVEWTTATEENNEKFILQRSTDGLNWTEVTEVKGAGNSINAITYRYKDNQVTFSGRYYYRLKQIDFDGAFTYSSPCAVDFSGADKPFVYLLRDQHEAVVAWHGDDISDISFFSMQGGKVNVVEKSNYTFDYSSLTPGIYIVRIQYSKGVVTQRIAVD
jgi:hypothetical protein